MKHTRISHLQNFLFDNSYTLNYEMIRVLDLYNFGDESLVTNPLYNAMFSSVPVFLFEYAHLIDIETRCLRKTGTPSYSYGIYINHFPLLFFLYSFDI